MSCFAPLPTTLSRTWLPSARYVGAVHPAAVVGSSYRHTSVHTHPFTPVPPYLRRTSCPPYASRLRALTFASLWLMQVVGPVAQGVSDAISQGPSVETAPSPWPVAPRKAKEAFATLLTTSNVEYFRGALVLGSSIRSFDASRDLVCLVTSSVPEEWYSALEVAGWTVHKVRFPRLVALRRLFDLMPDVSLPRVPASLSPRAPALPPLHFP